MGVRFGKPGALFQVVHFPVRIFDYQTVDNDDDPHLPFFHVAYNFTRAQCSSTWLVALVICWTLLPIALRGRVVYLPADLVKISKFDSIKSIRFSIILTTRAAGVISGGTCS